MKAENRESCLQRDSVERKGYAGARSIGAREGAERGGAGDLLEAILERDNLKMFHYRRKARIGRILRFPGAIRATSQTARMRLNRCIPNGTYGGVRGRLLN